MLLIQRHKKLSKCHEAILFCLVVRVSKCNYAVMPTLLRIKCLIIMKSSPDMSPESKGEMNHDATGEGGENVNRK